jgi:hypothetical protein
VTERRTCDEIADDLHAQLNGDGAELDLALREFGETGGGSSEQTLRDLLNEAIDALRAIKSAP